MESVRIRRARRGDSDELTRIAHAAKRHWGYPEEWIQSWKADLTVAPEAVARDPTYCAVIDAHIVGFYSLSGEGEGRELEHLWVDPAHMRAGVGRALFAHLLGQLRRMRVTLLTIDADPNAEGFYLRMGARRVGEVPSSPAGRSLPRLELQIAPLNNLTMDRPG